MFGPPQIQWCSFSIQQSNGKNQTVLLLICMIQKIFFIIITFGWSMFEKRLCFCQFAGLSGNASPTQPVPAFVGSKQPAVSGAKEGRASRLKLF